MNKYAYTLYNELQLQLEEENGLSFETKIADIFPETFDKLSWVIVLIKLELIYCFNIPDQIGEQTYLTIEEFEEKLFALPLVPKAIYQEFYELKIQMITDVIRKFKIRTGLEEGSEEDLSEIFKRLDYIERRLNGITEFPLY